MARKLDELSHNEIVFLDRTELNSLITTLTRRDERKTLATKVLKRAESDEVKKNTLSMYVPARVWEVKILFPDYQSKPPRWWARNK